MRYIAIMMALVSSLSIIAQKLQENEVPAIVVSNFKKTYEKTAINIVWDKVASNHYVVVFQNNGNVHSAKYDGNGNMHQLSIELSETQLPKTVKQIIKDAYGKKYRIKTAIETQYFVKPASYKITMVDKSNNAIEVLLDNSILTVLN